LPGLFVAPGFILDIAVTGLRLANCFFQLAFLFQALFSCKFAGPFFNGAFRFLDTTFDLIFIHRSLLLYRQKICARPRLALLQAAGKNQSADQQHANAGRRPPDRYHRQIRRSVLIRFLSRIRDILSDFVHCVINLVAGRFTARLDVLDCLINFFASLFQRARFLAGQEKKRYWY